MLVDGGWESIEQATGMELDEFLRNLDEPPEVMRSLAAFHEAEFCLLDSYSPGYGGSGKTFEKIAEKAAEVNAAVGAVA